MKVCSKCGRFAYYDNFCSEDGAKTIPAPRCGYDGKEIFGFTQFCKSCGRSRDEALATQYRPLIARIFSAINKSFSKRAK